MPSVANTTVSDKIFLATTFGTAIIGAALIIVGFVLRFGRGFGTFVYYARKDSDFLELGRLDIIFGIFTAAAIVLVLSFFFSAYAIFRRNRFILSAYCAVIALMVLVQLVVGLLAFTYSDEINQLASDIQLTDSLNLAKQRYDSTGPIPTDDQTQFWLHTQKSLNCCGVRNVSDWNPLNEPSVLKKYNCILPNYNTGCDKSIRSRMSSDAQFLGAAAMGVVLIEIIASFLAGYRAYNMKCEEM